MFALLFHAAWASGHLFILSGQSNMARWEPEKKFVPAVKRALRPEPVWHVKVAHGGKGIRHWVEGWHQLAKTEGVRGRPDPVEPTYYQEILRAVRQGRKEHGTPTTVTLVWVQGEADARRGWHAAYGASLQALVSQLERDLEVSDLNVVLGRLSDFEPGNQRAKQGWTSVRQAQMDFANAAKHRSWVDTDAYNDLGSKKKPKNDLHFTKKGYRRFAKRLAQEAILLTGRRRPKSR